MEKQRVKINEEQLNRIVAESVKRVLKESFGDRVRGAVQGFKQGQNQQSANDEDANELWAWVNSAKEVLKQNNPQLAMQFVQNFVKSIEGHKNWQAETYGNNLNYSQQ